MKALTHIKKNFIPVICYLSLRTILIAKNLLSNFVAINKDVTYLDICNYMPQRPMSGSPSGTALSLHLRSSSVTSSLASPGDSGVALDSDMDIANETDASSYKEVRKAIANLYPLSYLLANFIFK